MGLTCSVTPNSDPPLHTLDGLVTHLCTFSESRAPGPESTHAWQRTIHCKSISFRERKLAAHLLIPHPPIDITGRSVGGENAHDKFDCAALVSSFLGLLVLALPSRFGRQSHLLCLRSVLRGIRKQRTTQHLSPIPISDVTAHQIFIYSFLILRLHRAPAVRLIDSSTSRASTPTTSASSRLSHSPPPNSTTTNNARNAKASSTSHPHDYHLDPPTLLDGLSLSSAPIPLRTWHASGPVFGHPSLRQATFSHPSFSSSSPPPSQQASSTSSEMRPRDGVDANDDAMDWTPTASTVRPEPASRGPLPARKATDATTGLEALFERTNIIDPSEPSMSSRDRQRGGGTRSTQTWSWGWVYVLSLVPLVGVMYYHLR